MEEVDKIIIDSLRNMECDIEDEIENLSQFDADLVVLAVATCLETILQDITLPKKLPPSMSMKLKIASSLAELIKNLGFRGDMGYQTILYCNEVEVRRVLMFLIERLPRESNKSIPLDQTGYVPRIVKALEEKLQESTKQMWIPSCLLNKGIRESNGSYVVGSLGDSAPLETSTLKIPDSNSNSEDLKNYWIHDVPDVTKQCYIKKLIPSLLFKDLEFSQDSSFLNFIKTHHENYLVEAHDHIKTMESHERFDEVDLVQHQNPEVIGENFEEIKRKTFIPDPEEIHLKYKSLQDSIKITETELTKVESVINEEQEVLKDTLFRFKLKTKTLAVINKEENMVKLKNVIQNSRDRLVELSNQWNEIHNPLLEEYKSLQHNLTNDESKLQEDQFKLNSLKETHQKLSEDLKEKTLLEETLVQKCQQDAKQDETARRAYKLLAALRDECSSILTAVTDLGLAERESRNLQEQIEMEKSKDIAVKLESVYRDIVQIQKETEMLMT